MLQKKNYEQLKIFIKENPNNNNVKYDWEISQMLNFV